MSLWVYIETQDGDDVFSRNITHNLIGMANNAGVYAHIWRPSSIGIVKAKQLIDPLTSALVLLRSDRKRFEQFNPKNGWGIYDNFVQFVESYLLACKEYPELDIVASG